jgi:predicted DCC family thiol-disulfide oxidoreductase YuxK
MPQVTKPLLVYDGECNFCGRWIARWKKATGERVDYAPFQEVAGRFPEIPKDAFERASQLIEPGGQVSSAAHAVFRTLAYASGKRWMLWRYEKITAFRFASECFYRLVADHRVAFSLVSRIFWGKDVLPSTYFLSRWLFLRTLGLIYLIAFVSLWTQIDGLVGSQGILPVPEFLQAVQERIGPERYLVAPTLCWLDSSDAFLHFLHGGGVLLSILLILGIAPVPVLLLLWICYLSLTTISQDFLSFQWDILLLETGFLAIFFAPFRFLPKISKESSPSRTVLWLLRWLLFRLIFYSGAVKLASGDPTWRNLTALNYHYETQPLPPWTAWYAHQLPEAFQKVSVALMFGVELVLPFLIFAPRRLRQAACAGMVALQILIIITGNYCFFNLLTIALCLLLLDDTFWSSVRVAIQRRTRNGVSGEARHSRHWPRWIVTPVALAILLVSATQVTRLLRLPVSWPQPILQLRRALAPFYIVNSYGLFAIMTTSRPEIVLEGSDDEMNWFPYEFKYKPGDPKRRPRFVAPHQPRVDWQMWFAALSDFRSNPWFLRLSQRVLEGSPAVLGLLQKNPFPEKPPRYLRAMVYDYHFTDFANRRASGAWWFRERKGLYCPILSLRKAND